MANELPSARRGAGIDGTELTRQRHTSGWHGCAGLPTPRRGESGVTPAQVGEAGREAAERHPPLTPSVSSNDIPDVKPGEPGHLGEIRPVIVHQNFDDLVALGARPAGSD